MRKCPVCGVEHSDIVPVCSICGSSLTGAAVTETPAPKTEPAVHFTDADIQAAISSVVGNAVEKKAAPSEEKPAPAEKAPEAPAEAAPAEEDPFEIDSPFVVNAMKTPGQDDNIHQSLSKKGKVEKVQLEKAAEPVKKSESATNMMDTTAIAAASALKVQEAKKHAEAARAARQAAEEAKAAEEAAAAQTQQTAASEHNWTERKHKRGQRSTTTPVIAAVCGLLALLIIAMLFLLGKMMADDSLDDAEDPKDPAVSEPGEQDAQQGEDVVIDPDSDVFPNEENEGDILPEAGDEPAQEGEEDPNTEITEEPETPEEPQQPAEEENDLPAITEVADTVYTTDVVNVRDFPSTTEGKVLSVLSAGQAVTRTGKTDNDWSRVEVGGKVGYISNTYLSTTKNGGGDNNADEGDEGASTGKYAYLNAGGVNLRSEPSGTVLATLTEGQKVELTGKTSGNWTQVKVSGLTGYVYTSYLSDSADSSDDEQEPAKPSDDSDVKVNKTGDTVYATTGVYVRDYPSSSKGNVINALTKGQSVKRIGTTSNGWSKIEVGGVTGYVYSDYVSTSKNSSDTDEEDSGNSGGSSVRYGYILSESNSRKYTASELSGMSKSDLRLARNEIFARHGRKFNDKGLQDYFNSCSWYKGTVEPATFDANLEGYLNSYELANLDLIRSLE